MIVKWYWDPLVKESVSVEFDAFHPEAPVNRSNCGVLFNTQILYDDESSSLMSAMKEISDQLNFYMEEMKAITEYVERKLQNNG